MARPKSHSAQSWLNKRFTAPNLRSSRRGTLAPPIMRTKPLRGHLHPPSADADSGHMAACSRLIRRSVGRPEQDVARSTIERLQYYYRCLRCL